MYYVIWHQAVFPRLIEDQRQGIFGCTIFFFIVVLIITVFLSRYRPICSLLFNEGLRDSSSMNLYKQSTTFCRSDIYLCIICSQLNDSTELNPIWKLNFTFLVVIIFNFLCVQHINYYLLGNSMFWSFLKEKRIYWKFRKFIIYTCMFIVLTWSILQQQMSTCIKLFSYLKQQSFI